jgi:hypothetical protein
MFSRPFRAKTAERSLTPGYLSRRFRAKTTDRPTDRAA